MNRTRKVLYNSFFSLASGSITILLGLVTRRLFLKYIGQEFLGYDSLFSEIMALLSLTNFGIVNILNYRIYRAVAEANEEVINLLMNIYRFFFYLAAFLSLVIGMTISLFLKYIIKDPIKEWKYVYIVFYLQLFFDLAQCFWSYKRQLLIAYQKEFLCIKADTIFSIVFNFIQILFMIVNGNYIVYLFIGGIRQICANVLISHYTNRKYPFIHKEKITFKILKDNKIFEDIKNFIVHKVAYVVFGGIDNIVISTILGINSVALLSNYNLLKTYVDSILDKIFKPMQSGIGNLTYSDKSGGEIRKLFNGLTLLFYIIASEGYVFFFIIVQKFISQVWLGEKFVINGVFIYLYSALVYIIIQLKYVDFFRSAIGMYDKDKKFMVIAAVINLVISVFAAQKYGLVGIVLGTVLGYIIIYCGKIIVIFNYLLHENMKLFLIKQSIFFILTICIACVSRLCCSLVRYRGSIGLVISGITAMGISLLCNFLIILVTKERRDLQFYIYRIINLGKGK